MLYFDYLHLHQQIQALYLTMLLEADAIKVLGVTIISSPSFKPRVLHNSNATVALKTAIA